MHIQGRVLADLHYDSYENKQRLPLAVQSGSLRTNVGKKKKNCHETEKAWKYLTFRGDCAVREDILPPVPKCWPVLRREAEAVAKELTELVMNFPFGSDWGRRALSRAAALTEPLSVCSCWWIVWYTEQCSPWLYYWVCLFNYCVYIQNDVLVWLFASSATLFLATTVTSYSTVTKDSAYKTHGDFIHYDALSYIGPGNPTVYISRGQTLCQLKDQCVSSSGI